jgi:hypothetical protein
MNNYKESKKKIEKIRDDYREMAFRAGISHLMDVGIRHLTKDLVEETCEKIVQEDDTNHIMTNDFKCDILRVAYELAQIPHIDLLVYIQREVNYDVFDGGISYGRAINLLKDCVHGIEMQCDSDKETLDKLENMEFEEDDLIALGFEYLLEDEDN